MSNSHFLPILPARILTRTLEFRCAHNLDTARRFFVGQTSGRVCCPECFHPDDFFKYEEIVDFNKLHALAATGHFTSRCIICGRKLLRIKFVHDCVRCTERFLYKEVKYRETAV